MVSDIQPDPDFKQPKPLVFQPKASEKPEPRGLPVWEFEKNGRTIPLTEFISNQTSLELDDFASIIFAPIEVILRTN